MILDGIETQLFQRLATIVIVVRGLPLGNVGRYLYITNWDNGARWDVVTQGPIPTLAEINAITTTQINSCITNVRTTRRDKTLWTPQILALTREVHDRFRAGNVDNMQVSVFRAGVEMEYDTIVNP